MAEISPVRLNLNSPGQTAPQSIPPSTVIHGDNYTITQLPGAFAEEGPIFTDIDNDGLKEILVSTDTFPNPERHLLYVLKPNGTIKTGWPKPNDNDWGWYDSAKCLSGDIHASPGKEVILTNWDGTNIYTCNGDLLKRFPDRQWASTIANFVNPRNQLTINFWGGWSNILNENLNFINYFPFPFSISSAADINNDGEAEIIGIKYIVGYSQSNNTSIIVQKAGYSYYLSTNVGISCTVNNVHNYQEFYQGLPSEIKQSFPTGSEMEKALHEAFDQAKDWQIFVQKPDGTNVTGWPKELASFFPDGYANYLDTIAGDINRDGNYEIFFLLGKTKAGYSGVRTKIWGLNKNGQTLPQWEKTFSNTRGGKLYLTNATNNSYPNLVFFDSDNNQILGFDYKGNQIFQKKFPIAITNPPVFCDINKDGISEMLYSYGYGFFSYNFMTNSEKDFFNPDPSEVGVGSIVSSFAVGDIDRDGLLEVICGADKNNQCGLLIGQTAISANPLPGLDWPMLHNNPGRTNSQPRLPVITTVRHWDKYE